MKRRTLVPVAYALVSLAVFAVVLPVMGHSWIGLDADAKTGVYLLDLVADALRHGHDPLISNAIQAPGGVNLMWNPSLVLPGIVLTPLTLLAGPYAAYDVLVIAAPVLSAWAAFAVLRLYVRSPAAAWIGGLVYGFSPALLAESLGHAQTSMAWFPPVVLLLLHDALSRRRWPAWRTGALLGVATAAELLTSEEMVLITAVVAACALVVLAVQHRAQAGEAARRLGIVIGVGAATALVLAAVPLAVQFFGPYRPTGSIIPGFFVVADAGAFIVPASRQLVRLPGVSADPWSFVIEDSGAYIGVAVMLLLLLAWQRLRKVSAAVRWAAPCVLVTSLLALGPYLHLGGNATSVPLPWILLDKLPLLENVDPARIMVVAWLGIAVIVAAAVDHALTEGRRERLGWGALIAIALASLLPAAIPVTAATAPAYFTSADAATIPTGDTVLIAPLIKDAAGIRVLIWQVEAGLRWRMVNGDAYGANGPQHFPASTLTNTLTRLEADAPVDTTPPAMSAMRDDLRRLGVGTVIVAGGDHQQQELDLMRQLLGPQTYVGGGTFVWHNVAALIAGR